jgi:hypothetical protein
MKLTGGTPELGLSIKNALFFSGMDIFMPKFTQDFQCIIRAFYIIP